MAKSTIIRAIGVLKLNRDVLRGVDDPSGTVASVIESLTRTIDRLAKEVANG